MKNNKVKLLLALVGGSLFLNACYKEFDPKSYAPKLSINGYSSSNEIQPSHLISFWGFNGNTTDSLTNDAGTPVSVGFTKGVKGQAYQGSANGYSLYSPSSAFTNLHSYTIAFWMNTSVTNGAIGIFTLARTDDFWGNVDIFTDGPSGTDKMVFKCHMYNDNVSWGGQFIDTKIKYGNWTHIAITYDAATSVFNIYQDGAVLKVNSAGNPSDQEGPVLNGSDPSNPPVTPYGDIHFKNATAGVFGAFQFMTNPALNGGTSQPWAHDYEGALDEFRIYDAALTPIEVSSLFLLEGRGK